MTCSPQHLAEQIRQKGFRLTRQRMAILTVLDEAGQHLCRTEIYARIAPGLTEPTVYRNLDFLVEQDLVRVTHTGNGRLEYELARHPHHHLQCRVCGAKMELDANALQAFFNGLENSTGYRLSENHITLMGVCPNCKFKGD
ncbi:MAG: Fur family transcriptional regulator [Anaerolineales bacterium]|jgi:Fe2+ or Zn2+ uptake regulation protein|nr:Fur family transcriptional regulator [Anaerolineales bacterium]